MRQPYAKMMFDEADVFNGLTAWFSSSVPERVKSQWVKNGGIQKDDIIDADYIFSSNAASKDTSWIFESQKYQNEELTIFNSSLIEDTIASGKSYLSGRYTGYYILIHPAYQREIDSFLREKCPRLYRSHVQLTAVVDNKKNANQNSDVNKVTSNVMKQRHANKECYDEWDFKDELGISANSLSDIIYSNSPESLKEWNQNSTQLTHPNSNEMWSVRKQLNIIVVDKTPLQSSKSTQQQNSDEHPDDGDLTDGPSDVYITNVQNVSVEDLHEDHQPIDNHTSDEWEFKDDSNIHITNFRESRRLSEKPVGCTNKNWHFSSRPTSSSVFKAVKSSTVKQPRRKSLPNITSVTSSTSAGKDRRKCLAHDTDINMLEENDLTNSHCADTTQQYGYCSDVEERGNLLDDTQFKNNVTSATPAYSRSHFLSSMDDGVVHIDDVKLAHTPIFDFIPNHNGCRVDSK